MARYLSEYINKKLGILQMQEELQTLIKKYNDYTGRYLFVFASDFSKSGKADTSLVMDDFYNIHDILQDCDAKKLDFYIETPGGRGEAAEEIARFLHKKFEEVKFIVAGEAKSAGTILVLSGDDIAMTDSGSLGPIDAQVRIGRSVVSAHDYKEWVEGKKRRGLKKR